MTTTTDGRQHATGACDHEMVHLYPSAYKQLLDRIEYLERQAQLRLEDWQIATARAERAEAALRAKEKKA